MTRPAFAPILLSAAALAACAGHGGDGPPPRVYGAEWAGEPGTLALTDVPFPAHLRDLHLTIYPTPRTADYGEILLPLDGAEWVDEGSSDLDLRLRASGLEIGWDELPPEGYVLATIHESGRTVVVLAARDAAGRTWADLAFSQMVHEDGGRRFVRACRVLDAPVFPLRGNKRPQGWERRYRANFTWEADPSKDDEGRVRVATYAAGSPLDASPEHVDRILDRWRPWQERGVRRFCLKFDDVDFDLTPATRETHGDYPRALRAMITMLRDGLRRRDPTATLLYLPQTYWWMDPRLPAFCEALRAAGGLERDVGLVMTGPEIVSDAIDELGLAATRVQFGLFDTPALVYDNLGREGDWGPLRGRDPRLRTQCEGVFGERGTPVHRLTRLDWLWNPHDYDPERSWRRAILELAGPTGFDALHAACGAYRRRAAREEAAVLVGRFGDLPGPDDGAVPRRDLAGLLRADLRRLPASSDSAARTLR